MGAKNALADAGIQLYGGVTGSADEAVKALLEGNLSYNPDIQCSHHGEGHHHGGSCHGEGHQGGHCGEDKHGCRKRRMSLMTTADLRQAEHMNF